MYWQRSVPLSVGNAVQATLIGLGESNPRVALVQLSDGR